MNTKTVNAKITHATLQGECNYFTAYIHFESYEFDINSLDCWCVEINENNTTYQHNAISKLMQILEIGAWEELKGKYVRIEVEEIQHGKVIKIGHTIKDQWFKIE